MKKISLLLLLSPAMAFAQSDVAGGTDILTVFIFIGFVFLVFFICRELFCWYWKVNKLVANQEETIRLLKKIAKEDAPELANNHMEEKKLSQRLKDSSSLY